MALTYQNIATIINTQIMKNATGDNSGTVIAEDLTNLVEVAKVVNSSSIPDMRNALSNLVVGVHNWVIERMLETKNYKLLRDAVEYGGGIQRIMASGLFTAKESHLLNLASGTNYHDGQFYGLNPSSAIVEDTKTFKVVVSVADDFYSTWFTDAGKLAEWLNLVAVTEENTIRKELAELEKRIIVKAVAIAMAGNRKVNFIDGFNTMEGRTTAINRSATPKVVATLTNDVKWDLIELKKYRDEFAYFGSFCKEVIARLVDYVKEPNKKYNDGTVITWTPTNKVGIILNSQFAQDIKYLGNPVEFNPSAIVEYDTVSTWQDLGTAMLPDYSTSATINIAPTTSGGSNTTYSNVVGLVYDLDGCGITTVKNKTTYEDVGAEGFANLHHHLANKYYVDPRLSAVALVLE